MSDPLTRLQFSVEDVTKTYERVLGPVDLFAPFNTDKGSTNNKFELQRPVTPINVEVKRSVKNSEELVKLVEKRLTVCRDGRTLLTADGQTQLISVIIAEVHNAWPNVKSLADDPALTAAENHELRRRITVHIVTVCQSLFEHYLLKANLLNSRAVFSSEANLSRLKTQLALDANKFLNVLVIRRYILADLLRPRLASSTGEAPPPGTEAPPTSQRPRRQQQDSATKLPSHQRLIETTYRQSATDEQSTNITQHAVQQMLHAMPSLDYETLSDIIVALPQLNTSTQDVLFQRTDESTSHVNTTRHRSSSEDESRQKVVAKRCTSVGDLLTTLNDDSSPELTTTTTTTTSSSLRRPMTAGKTHSTGVCQSEVDVTSQLQRQQQQQFDVQTDLKRLTTTTTTTTTTPSVVVAGDSDDLCPLLQAIGNTDNHDEKIASLNAQLHTLEERDRQRQLQECVYVPRPVHIQPTTVTKKMPGAGYVRMSGSRCSDRVCLSTSTLKPVDVMYNELNNEIDSLTVKQLDRNLVVEDEISVVYNELSKTLNKDFLNMTVHEPFKPCDDFTLNVAEIIASATVGKRKQHRIINPELQREKQQLKTTPRSEMKRPKGKMPGKDSKSFASWLDWWKNTINTDDYMKYLATQDTDFLHVVFHLYDSDDDSDSTTTTAAAATADNKQTANKVDERCERELAELRRQKTEFNAGMWNVNSVLLGGLGKDPPQLHTEVSDSTAQQTTTDSHSVQTVTHRGGAVGGAGGGLEEEIGGEAEDGAVGVVVDGAIVGAGGEVEEVVMGGAAAGLEERALSRTVGGVGGGARGGTSRCKSAQYTTTTDSSRLSASVSRCKSAQQTRDRESEESVSYVIDSKEHASEPTAPTTTTTTTTTLSRDALLQQDLEFIWTSLQMPDLQRLDMALKYATQYNDNVQQVVETWKSATRLVMKREQILSKLETFERTASCPSRLVAKVNSSERLSESRTRTTFNKKLSAVETVLRDQLIHIQNKFKDTVTYEGRPYLEKMRCDRTEMLYWLQEERKVNALKCEAPNRHLPPLAATLTEL